jgi:hypothetical protein
MTLTDFKDLDKDEQVKAAYKGVFLDFRISKKLNIFLYDLGGFYVEIICLDSNNKVLKLHSFRSTKHLQLYLDEMSNAGIMDLLGI